MKRDNAPLEINDREKTIAFDLFQRLKDIEEQYTGERIVGDPSSLNLDTGDKGQETLMADASTEMDQAPDSFLRPRRYDIIEGKELPAETLDDFDVMFRKPNATGGRVMLADGSIDDFVEIVRKMVADPEYMSPININAKEVGRIPNFEAAKKIVKQEMGEVTFNEAYQKNLNRSRKVRAKEKRKVDPELREKYLASKAETRRKRRVLKLGDKTKLTPKEKYLNFQQSLIQKQLNEKIRKNPNIILNNKKLMDDISTTVDKNGNIIKKKVNLSDITNRGIFEIEHQRDVYKKGTMKDFPYNRNLILGPHNRTDGFKNTAEKFITNNPKDPKVKNLIKKAEKLKITLQPDVPKGIFKTKGLGYKQVADPVNKFTTVARSIVPEISGNLGLTAYEKNLSAAQKSLGLSKDVLSDLTKIEGVTTADKIARPEKALLKESFKKLSKPGIMGALKASRFLPVVGAIATPALAAYGLYDAYKKGYTRPDELLASAAFGSGVSLKDKIKYAKSKKVATTDKQQEEADRLWEIEQKKMELDPDYIPKLIDPEEIKIAMSETPPEDKDGLASLMA